MPQACDVRSKNGEDHVPGLTELSGLRWHLKPKGHKSRASRPVVYLSHEFYTVYRQSPLGPVDPSFRALSGRLKFTIRRHKFNNDYLSRGSFPP